MLTFPERWSGLLAQGLELTSGLNVTVNCRSNNVGSGGGGKGEARYAAATIDSRTA
jgi:hypothetical protein